MPIRWDVGFETVGEKWLGITIPVVGDEPQEPTLIRRPGAFTVYKLRPATNAADGPN